MELKTLQKAGGYAIIAGAVSFVAWALCWNFLLPVQEMERDFSILVSHPNWIWISLLAFPGIILTIFGFMAVYSRLHKSSGWLGFTGFVLITVAYILQAAELSWEIFLYPAIAAHASSSALFRENLLVQHPMVMAFQYTFLFSILPGVILFGAALIRSKEFRKTGGMLFLAGALLYAVGPMLTIYLGILGVLLFAAGCIVIGVDLAVRIKNP